MSLQTRLEALVAAVGADVKSINLNKLTTDTAQAVTGVKSFAAGALVAFDIKPPSGQALLLRDQAGTTRARVGPNGLTLFKSDGTEINGGGVGVLGIADAGTIPSTNPTGGVAVYSDGGVLKIRQPNGTVVTVANSAGGANMVTTDSDQTITGKKIFSANLKGGAAVDGEWFSTTMFGALAFNAEWNGTAWVRKAQGTAARISFDNATGNVEFTVAASGAAGSTITWTYAGAIGTAAGQQVMTLGAQYIDGIKTFAQRVISNVAMRASDFELTNTYGSYAINAAWDGTKWVYIGTGRAFLIQHDNATGDIRFKTAVSGTAGGTIAWLDRGSIGESGLRAIAANGWSGEAYSDANPPQTMMLTEYPDVSVATPPANIAQLWTPDGRSLKLKDDAGVVTTIGPSAGGASGVQVYEVAADRAFTTTTPTDISDWVIPMAANEVVTIDAILVFQSAALTTGFGFSAVPRTTAGGALTVSRFLLTIEYQTSATAWATATQTVATTPMAVTTAAYVANSGIMCRITGQVENGATAGVLAFQARSEVAGSAITVRKGSPLRVM